MRNRPERAVSGWRARRFAEAGGLFVRDGASFRVYRLTDERSRWCGRAPAHVVARLSHVCGLQAHREDPDRLVSARARVPRALLAIAMPEAGRPAARPLLDELTARAPASAGRINAAAMRFRGDYHLAALPGRLKAHSHESLAAARRRLGDLDAALGADSMMYVEALAVDRLTAAAFGHVFGGGAEMAGPALARLAAAYGLPLAGQEAGSAFASA